MKANPVQIIQSTIEEHTLLPEEGGLVIAGYSGGADSSAMLHALHQLRETLPIRLHAAHLHHGMRPEADSDAQSCRAFAESLGIPITIERIDVPEQAKRQKISIEEAGRQVRYAFFERLASEIGACRIATAHTRNDRIETILINLLRGTGTCGLRGIPYRRGNIIRPLLNVSREQTHAYCKEYRLPVLFDVTNLDPRQLRGRVRRELLPLMRDLSPGVEGNLLRTAEIINLEEEYWEQEMQGIMRSSIFIKPDVVYIDELTRYHTAVQRRFLREWIMRDLPPGETPSFEAIDGILKAVQDGHTFSWTFGKEMHLNLHPPHLKIIRTANETVQKDYEYSLIEGEPLFVTEANASIIVREVTKPEGYHSISPNETWLAAEAVQGRLYVRNRRTGDRFQPLGMSSIKLISHVMADRKWDKRWRTVCPLLCDGSGILWVPGYTIADRAKITAGTRRFLMAKLNE